MTTGPAREHASGWYPDPSRRGDYRYWDRAAWTNQVTRRGLHARDDATEELLAALPPPETAGWVPRPGGATTVSWWDGHRLDDTVQSPEVRTRRGVRRAPLPTGHDVPLEHVGGTTPRDWLGFLRRPSVIVLILLLCGTVWAVVSDAVNGHVLSAGMGVCLAVGVVVTLAVVFRRRTRSAVERELSGLAALRARGVITDDEYDELIAQLGADVEAFLRDARSTRQEAAHAGRAAPRWLASMVALAAAGTVVLVIGARLAFRTPDLPMSSAGAPGCTDAAIADFVAPLWLPWLLMGLLLLTGVALWVRFGRQDWRMTLLVGLGAAASFVTFPLWMQILSGMSCAT